MSLSASQHVVLEVVGGMNGGCGPSQLDFVRNLPDGGQESGLGGLGWGGISEAMTSGIVVSSKARICPDIFPGPTGPPGGFQHLILRGYLIADI